MNNIAFDIVVETNLSLDEFHDKFVEWIKNNHWECAGKLVPIDSVGQRIGKQVKWIECDYERAFNELTEEEMKQLNSLVGGTED